MSLRRRARAPLRAVVWAPDPGARYPRWLVPALEAAGARVALDTGAAPPRARCDVAYVPPGRPRPRRAARVVAVVDERPATRVAAAADALVLPARALLDVARELAPGLPTQVLPPLAAPAPEPGMRTAGPPPGAPAPGTAGPPPAADAPRIVCAAPLDWQAGHEHALMALRAARDQGIAARMEIRGDGPLRDAVVFTIDDLGLSDAVTIAPPLDPAGLRGRLAGASAFLLAAVTDAAWAEPIEAMAAGVPVVATDVPTLRELIGDGGLLTPARDPAALAAGLARVLLDDGLAARLARAGAERAAAAPPAGAPPLDARGAAA